MRRTVKWSLLASAILVAVMAGGAVRVIEDPCGPFTDVSALFCPYVLEAYYTGITAGTSATTFSPDVPTSRAQAAVFSTKALDQAITRGSRRAALGQWWTSNSTQLAVTSLPHSPYAVASDGTDVWVANGGLISRVHASDGRLLDSWTSSGECVGALLIAMGRVFASDCNSMQLTMLDPSQPAGPVTPVANVTGNFIGPLAFDGTNIWVVATNLAIVTPGPTLPWTVTTVNLRVGSVLFDGVNMWGTQFGTPGSLLRLDPSGAVIQTVPVGRNPWQPIFDGENIWIPDPVDHTVMVVRADTGAVLQTLSGNGLNPPVSVAFDGQRVMVTSSCASLWKAADLSPLGCFPLPAAYLDTVACSDGINFWLGISGQGLVRF